MPEIRELRRKLLRKARKGVEERYSGRDAHVVKAVALLEDLDNCYNLLFEQCREWFGVHFPELEREAKAPEKYLKLVCLGKREKFSLENVKSCYNDDAAAQRIAEKARASMGSETENADVEQTTLLAENALRLREERQGIAAYIERTMKELCPNVLAVAGPLVGGKLLARAGNLKKLAFMPGSTIQVLGAEKALFAHLHKGKKPPKHGYLFQHPLVKAAPRKEKGKVARKLSGKIAIAARADYYGKRDISGELLKGLEARGKRGE